MIDLVFAVFLLVGSSRSLTLHEFGHANDGRPAGRPDAAAGRTPDA